MTVNYFPCKTLDTFRIYTSLSVAAYSYQTAADATEW